jgi:hypothetical protein
MAGLGIASPCRHTTFPIERLAEYPRELPKLCGEHSGVYFGRRSMHALVMPRAGPSAGFLAARIVLGRRRPDRVFDPLLEDGVRAFCVAELNADGFGGPVELGEARIV